MGLGNRPSDDLEMQSSSKGARQGRAKLLTAGERSERAEPIEKRKEGARCLGGVEAVGAPEDAIN